MNSVAQRNLDHRSVPSLGRELGGLAGTMGALALLLPLVVFAPGALIVLAAIVGVTLALLQSRGRPSRPL